MAVDQTGILALYDAVIARHKVKLDAEFDSQRISSDLYSKALVSLLHQSMQLAVSTVQQQPMIEAQIAKTVADTAFVGTQEIELSNSVIFNNKIKALDSYGDMIGTMGAGSLVISTDMWTSFFAMVNDLNSSCGVPTSKVVVKL
jgi:hypothetical protein